MDQDLSILRCNMGAWGLGPFDNDAACDWLVELGEEGPEAIDLAFQAVLDEADGVFIDSETGSRAVAAMEILARVKEEEIVGDELLEISGIDANMLQMAFTPSRVVNAKQAAELVVREYSELAQLWADADQFEDWKRTVDEISRRLVS